MASLDANTTIKEVMELYGSHANGKTYVITGPSQGGIGAELARGLASGNPKHLILTGRSQAKIQPVIEDIKNINSNIDVRFVYADLLDNSTIRQAAADIKKITSEIHGLVNNAGIMAPKDFSKSKDGIESQFAANHVGHFLLTNLLAPELKNSKAVVINVTSTGYQLNGVFFEDPNFQASTDGKTYDGWQGYAQSKTANILFAASLAKKLAKYGGAAYSVTPGVVMETALMGNSGVTMEYLGSAIEQTKKKLGENFPTITPVSIQQGTATIALSLLDAKLQEYSGSFLEGCQVQSLDEHAAKSEYSDRLWQLSEKLVGETYEW